MEGPGSDPDQPDTGVSELSGALHLRHGGGPRIHPVSAPVLPLPVIFNPDGVTRIEEIRSTEQHPLLIQEGGLDMRGRKTGLPHPDPER